MKKNFKDNLLQKINKENIEPIKESYFENKKKLIWLSIGIIFLLAIVFSGFLYDDSTDFFKNGMYSRGNSFTGFGPNIVWIGIIIFLIYLGIKSFKETPVGYRNSYYKDIIIGFVIILIGTYLFRGIGLGQMMHSSFVDNIPGVSNILYNESAWNDPKNGRLAGEIIEYNNTFLKLKSIDGADWKVYLTGAFISPMSDTDIGEKIRIIGTMSSDNEFSAERIMPWFGRGMMNGQGGGMMNSGGRGYGRGMMGR